MYEILKKCTAPLNRQSSLEQTVSCNKHADILGKSLRLSDIINDNI
jgi:hypothetical protein